MTGGVAALTLAAILGPRRGKFGPDGKARVIPGHSGPFVALGTLILFFGWFGFNGGSVLAADGVAIAPVLTTTVLAGCAGGIAAMLYTWLRYRKPDLSRTCNGILAGLVGVTAGPDLVGGIGALGVGLVAGVLVALSVAVADRLARSIVRPTQRLAVAAHRLGDGALDTRVEPDGPPELVELSSAFNSLGAQVSSMLERERELVAELSHRLRTPLTKLRMRLEQVGDVSLAEELRGDLDDVATGPDVVDVAVGGVMDRSRHLDLLAEVAPECHIDHLEAATDAEDRHATGEGRTGDGEVERVVGGANLPA